MTPHFVNLFTQPLRAWDEIRDEERQNSLHYLGHLLLLALIPAFSLYVGTTEVGWSLARDEVVRLQPDSALQLAIGLYLTSVIGVVLMGSFVRWMSRTFEVRPNFNQCVGFVAYVATPLFIAGLASLYPSRWLALLVLGLACAYSTVLLYVGVPIFMRMKREQSMLYATSIWAVGLLVLVTLLVSVILHWQFYMTPEYQEVTHVLR
ncbi:YIP1 family protein [Pseudomonas sp. BN414]|uniref:Yip1 family protein n=1 Tax=Pseudomonas sp. BN414 TaxID=2567888 RepID=UPI002455CE69|nr:Yip1 family protein [Pseudomonas sp. BN414]MDH4565699.1 YIP1 family protein [Pseudomonas sp. BN414]